MADLGSIAALKSAWDAIVNNTVPDESIEPDDHNALIDDLLDTTAGLDKVLRHNAETGGYNLTVTAGDLIRLADSGFFADIDTATLTADRTITFQDASGVVAFLSDIPAGVTELNDLSDVNTGLPVSPTQADDGKMLFFDTSVGDFITDDTVTHGTSVINGKKASAGTIAKGKPVYLVGYDADLHTVEEANATSSATMPVIGFAAETMDDTNSKHIMTFGKLTGIDTSIYSVGDDLYIDTSTGGLTTTRPTGTALIQRVAKVLRSDVSGGQLLIYNTARTAGLPNLPQNNFWIGDANAEPQANTAAQARTVLNVADGANNYTHPNHTGEVTSTGDGATVVDKTAISNKTDVTIEATDILLFGDTSDSDNLKKGAVQDILDLVPPSGGKVGVPDASGIFTYSTDVKTAIEGATAGQTVFLFGDCETTTTITIPDGVNIQGNGFKIFNNQNDGTRVFTFDTLTGYVGNWFNLVIERTIGVANPIYVPSIGGGGLPIEVTCSNVKVTSDGAGGAFCINNAYNRLDNFFKGITCVSDGGGISSLACKYIDCKIFTTTGDGLTINNSGQGINCYVQTVSGRALLNGVFFNCTAITVSGKLNNAGTHYNGSYLSTSGILCDTGSWYSTTGQTTSTTYGHGGAVRNSVVYQNGSGAGHETGGNSGPIENSHIISIGGIGINKTLAGAPIFIRNSIVESGPDATDHGITCGSNSEIINCTIIVGNASANGIIGTSCSYSGNKVLGATTKYNVTTQLDTANKDNQGNS